MDGVRSVALFEGPLREAIHQFKYSYVQELAEPLSEMLISFWQQNPFPVRAIVPVPLHARRLRERGYNQATLLAQRLGIAVKLPVYARVLRRTRYTMSQARLGPRERRRNVQGAFSCVGSDVHQKGVVLIDDVFTTGATLQACSLALREGGAASVWALTIARPGTARALDHNGLFMPS